MTGLAFRRPLHLEPARPHHYEASVEGLEAKMAQERFILTESQLAALEKAKAEKEVQGEFETECPGYCGAQDTFYVGTLKGVGH